MDHSKNLSPSLDYNVLRRCYIRDHFPLGDWPFDPAKRAIPYYSISGFRYRLNVRFAGCVPRFISTFRYLHLKFLARRL